jgi:hypothetical protein
MLLVRVAAFYLKRDGIEVDDLPGSEPLGEIGQDFDFYLTPHAPGGEYTSHTKGLRRSWFLAHHP